MVTCLRAAGQRDRRVSLGFRVRPCPFKSPWVTREKGVSLHGLWSLWGHHGSWGQAELLQMESASFLTSSIPRGPETQLHGPYMDRPGTGCLHPTSQWPHPTFLKQAPKGPDKSLAGTAVNAGGNTPG